MSRERTTTLKRLKKAAIARVALLASIAIANPLPAQQPAGIEPPSHRDRHAFARSTPATVIGGVLGAVIGAVAGNQYAEAHNPPCMTVPAGPPCRYLDPDNSSSYRGLGIGLGAGLGVIIGILRAR